MKKFFAGIMEWMLAHPVIEQLLESLGLAIVLGTYGAIQSGIADSKTGLTYGAISAAVVMAIKGWYGLNKTLILAQAQDAIGINIPIPTSAALTAVTAPPTVPCATCGGTGTVTKLILAIVFASMLFMSSAFAAPTILSYSNGQVSNLPVTSSIKGDFLAFGVQGGFVPFHFVNGVLTADSTNFIATVDYLFISGSISPNTSTGLNLAADWWTGPALGGGLFSLTQSGTTSNLTVAHGFAGWTEGFSALGGNIDATEGVDIDTKVFYLGGAIQASLDFMGGFGFFKL